MADDAIFQLIYRSTLQRGRIDSPLAMLRDIVKVSQQRNGQSGLTGFLLFDGLTFVQVLEGAEQAVWITYAKIGKDPRHRDVELLNTGVTRAREFAHWQMEGRLGQAADREILNRHGSASGALADVPAGAIHRLMVEFSTQAENRKSDGGGS